MYFPILSKKQIKHQWYLLSALYGFEIFLKKYFYLLRPDYECDTEAQEMMANNRN